MSRLGWAMLVLIAAATLAFGSMLRFGGAQQDRVAARAVPASRAGLLTVPVTGVARARLVDSWGDPREGGARTHHGLDIPAPGGTPVTAAGAGLVEKLFISARGGRTVYQRSSDGGWMFYYAHLSAYAPGLHEGQRLAAGDPVGLVGDTGDAGPGNTHLHFGMTRMRAGERWWQGDDVDPYPHLAGTGGAR